MTALTVETTESSRGAVYVALTNLSRRPLAVVSSLIVIAMVVCALWPQSALPHDPRVGDSDARFVPPIFLPGGSSEYLLGADELGRDIFSMVIAGARYSLIIAVSGALIGLVLGASAGIVAGFYGGRVAALVMRLADIQLAFPMMVLLIAVVAAFGANLTTLILILGVTAWAPYARVTYTSTLSLREKEFVEAARASGLTGPRIMIGHILPNLVSPLIVLATFEVAQLFVIESGLSFLGLGVQPPNPSWGSMIAGARAYINDYWWASAIPGLFIVAVVLAFNLLGDELRDEFDPESS